MQNARMYEWEGGIKYARRNINNPQTCKWHHPNGRMKRGTKELFILMMKEQSEWQSLLEIQHSKNEDHGICSHHLMGNRWGNNGRLFWGGSKITADGDWSHEIKRCLLLGRKVMTNIENILKRRDITLAAKVCLVNTMVFPVVTYRCESWIIKKTECQRIDAFEVWCWRRLLRVR